VTASALLLILALWDGQSLSETPEWKTYQARLADAFAIEVRWAEWDSRKDASAQDQKERFRVLTMKPDYALYEETGVRRIVWNGKSGIDLDIKAKTFTRLASRPEFEEARWLALPLVPMKATVLAEEATRGTEKVGSQWWPKVSFAWGHWAVGPGGFGGGRMSYVFDPKRRLIAWVDDPLSPKIQRVKLFDVEALLIRSDFPVGPPEGFTEKKAGG
jgi:hypothetical protein